MADRDAVRAGVFVLIAVAILAVGTLWILGSPMAGDQADYEIQMASSGGVRRGDRVRLSGIEVGRVVDVRLLDGEELPVLFRVSVDDEVRLTRGTSARLTTDGLLGAPHLELISGPVGGEPLPAGSRIVGLRGSDINQTLDVLGSAGERLPELLDRASSTLGTIETEMEPLLASLQRLLSDENVDTVSRIIRKLEPTVEEVGGQLTELAGDLESLAGEIEEGLGGVPELTAELRGLVGDLRTALGPDGSRLTGVLESAEGTLGTADGALSTLDLNRDEIEATLLDLRESAANLRALTSTLKERPSLLLRYPEPPDRRPGDGVER